jgi:protein SCO1/2
MNTNQETQGKVQWSLSGLLIPAIVLLILVTFNYLRPDVAQESSLEGLGYVPQLETSQVGHFELLNQHGVFVDESLFMDKWSLVFFGFTHCPDFCPTTLSVLVQLESKMQENAPQIILVSVDPERDTPEKLGAYAGAFSPNIVTLTGTVDEIQNLSTMLHAVFSRQPNDTGNDLLNDSEITYQVDHTVNVALIDPNGTFIGDFKVPHRVPEMSIALAQLMSP